MRTAQAVADRRHLVGLAALLAVGIVAATAAVQLDWRLAVPLGMTLPLALWVTMADASHPPSAPALPVSPRGIRVFHSEAVLGWTWLALLVAPGVNVFSQTSRRYSGQAASGNLTIDNLVMLAASMVALVAVGFALQRGWPARPTILSRVFLLFTVLALASTVWSRLPLYSFGRGIQYVAIGGLTVLTASRCAADRGLFPRLIDRITRPYVAIVSALALWGVATHGFADRFQWPGTHPNGCASIMALAVLLVLVNPRRARVLAPVPWWLPVVLLVPLVTQTGARGNTMTMVGAVVVAAAILGMRDARWLGVVLGVGLMAAAAALSIFFEEIVSFVHRGQSTDAVLSLNGRVEAWQYALEHPVGSELWGVGLGANQGTSGASWNPYNSHSAWIDLLQTLGVLGVSLMATVVLAAIAISVLRRFAFGAMMGAFALVASTTSSTLAVPDRMPALLGLVVAGVAAAPYPLDAVGLLRRRPLAASPVTPEPDRELVDTRA